MAVALENWSEIAAETLFYCVGRAFFFRTSDSNILEGKITKTHFDFDQLEVTGVA